MYDVEGGIALEPMQGNWVSSQFDLAYTELYHIPTVKSVSFLTCDSVLRDSLDFHEANQFSLCI